MHKCDSLTKPVSQYCPFLCMLQQSVEENFYISGENVSYHVVFEIQTLILWSKLETGFVKPCRQYKSNSPL